MSFPVEPQLWAWQHGAAERIAYDVEEIQFSGIPGWDLDRVSEALRANLTLAPELAAAADSEAAARTYIESRYQPYRVIKNPGLLTAYYEPELRGSRTRQGAYTVPVYRRPPDLAPVDESADALKQAGLTAGLRTAEGLKPYPTREAIETGALEGRGLELLYVDDPLDAYLMHVQGSGLVRLAEGGTVRLAFDGKNGHPYSSVGRMLIEKGLLAESGASLDRVLDILRSDPGRGASLLRENKSYIFFREREEAAEAPTGSSGARLVPGRSLAVDPRYHAFGSLIWVSAPPLQFDGQPFPRLLAAHDTGSAIQGAQRGDLFCGTGADAGYFAGRVRHACEFIVLRPKA